jgi:SpoVK/Ycf46/Vps4 family AAA+-type ATPase
MEDDDFRKITGIELPYKMDEDGDLVLNRKAITKLTNARITAQFERRLTELSDEQLIPVLDDGMPFSDLPIVRNIDLLGNRLGLNEADKAILRFAVALNSFGQFRSVISCRNQSVTNAQLVHVIAELSNLPEADIAAALKEDAPLRTADLIRVESGPTDLESKIDVINRLAPLVLSSDSSEETLISHFLRPAGLGSLHIDDFPHLASDIETVLPYLRNAFAKGEHGINVLFYGPPGTGKTEMTKALAQELGTTLFEISYADDDGDPIKGKGRLRAYNLCQRFTANMPNALLMFDEVEDVLLPGYGSLLAMLFGGGESSKSAGKAWINRTLERNPVPAIWITNNAHIDPAYLRRFDYSVRFPIPPQSARMTIARHHFAEFKPSEQWLERIAANEHTSPAQLERAARVARIVAQGDHAQAQTISERTLDRSATLLQQKRIPARNVLRTGYDLSFVNANIDLPRLIAGLKRRPQGTFCFYGPAGTGKSELGRHLADAIDKPVLMRRASDILSKWVGESEKNIAEMFSEARQRDVVLILDEADSFLADRRDAHASWEVTQVNELLTQMEAFEGIFVCTTNLMQKLDQASLRRFAFKVKFDYLTTEQREAMFLKELVRLNGDAAAADEWLPQVRRLEQLTPGDFTVAVRQFELWDSIPSPGELYEQLHKECVAKGAPMRSIGFAA